MERATELAAAMVYARSKIEPFAAYLMQHSPAVFYVGLRADEERREGGDYQDVPNVEMVFPLREAGMGLAEVLQFNADRQIGFRGALTVWSAFSNALSSGTSFGATT